MDEAGTGRGWGRKGVGWGLLALGVAGCVLPVAPGIPFVLAGLVILGRDYAWARQAVGRLKRWAARARTKMRARTKA